VVERAQQRAGAGREGEEFLGNTARVPAGVLRLDLDDGDDGLAVGADHHLAPVGKIDRAALRRAHANGMAADWSQTNETTAQKAG
jgi:hypothetical protein